jgi:hypothetical protein
MTNDIIPGWHLYCETVCVLEPLMKPLHQATAFRLDRAHPARRFREYIRRWRAVPIGVFKSGLAVGVLIPVVASWRRIRNIHPIRFSAHRML